MSNYNISLEKYKSNEKSRFPCPNCSNPKSFTRYIYNTDSSYINDKVGKCNRESKCGYHYTPKEYFKDNTTNSFDYKPSFKTTFVEQKKNTSFIDISIFKDTLNDYESNNFISFLLTKFDIEKVVKAIQDYKIGTISNKTVFWQIDIDNKIRTGKIILYDKSNGKRSKTTNINWIHSFKKIKDYNLSQCLFGEHLINDSSKTIGIVESEKTAIICSIVMPKRIWLATGSKQNLNKKICENIKNRKVCLYPDTDAFIDWKEKAKTFNIGISNYIQEITNSKDLETGYDLADFILNAEIKQSENISIESTKKTIQKDKFKSIYNYDFDKKTIKKIIMDRNFRMNKKEISNKYNISLDEVEYILNPDALFQTYIKIN